MTPGDPILYVDIPAGKIRPGTFVAIYGARVIIELMIRGKPVLRYADPADVRPVDSAPASP